ncbi:MAG: hypothetical protein RL662_767 [Bacteroidota bacterium]|jgi:hypothetical protein
MRKRLLLGIFTLVASMSSASFAQVGINTETPKATLDVVGDDNVPYGIIPPRISGDDLTSKDDQYGADQNGAIIYATTKPTAPSTKTQQVASVGYYYYEAESNVWLPLTPPKNIESKIYCVVTTTNTQTITGTVAAPRPIVWSNVAGLNAQSIQLVNNGTEIVFPAQMTFKVTGMIGISDGSAAATYAVTQFEAVGGGSLAVSTWGYSESSTENFHDGGVTNPITVFSTGNAPLRLSLMASRPGNNNRDTKITGAPSRSSLGTYLLIEQIY